MQPYLNYLLIIIIIGLFGLCVCVVHRFTVSLVILIKCNQSITIMICFFSFSFRYIRCSTTAANIENRRRSDNNKKWKKIKNKIMKKKKRRTNSTLNTIWDCAFWMIVGNLSHVHTQILFLLYHIFFSSFLCRFLQMNGAMYRYMFTRKFCISLLYFNIKAQNKAGQSWCVSLSCSWYFFFTLLNSFPFAFRNSNVVWLCYNCMNELKNVFCAFFFQ